MSKHKRSGRRERGPGHGRSARRARDYGLEAHPLSAADQDEMRAAFTANAAEMVARFPELQAELLNLLRTVFPVHLVAVIAQYGLSSPISSVTGIRAKTFMPQIQQHHVELLQAFALHLPEAEWGRRPAASREVERAIALLPELCDAFHARRFLAAENLEGREERYQLMLREKIRLHTQMVRNWGHEGQVLDISRRLYAPLDPLFREAHGFSLSEFIDVAKSLVDLQAERSNERFDKLKRIFARKSVEAAVREHFALFAPAVDPASVLAGLPGDLSLDMVRARLISMADIHLVPMASYSAADVAAASGVDAAAAEAVLDALSLEPGAFSDIDREHLFLANPVWDRPLVRWDSDYLTSAPQVIFSFIHPIVRRLAATPRLDKALRRRRAEFLEGEAKAILEATMPDAEIRTGTRWRVGDQSFETDIAIRLGGVLIVAEAKSGSLTDAGLRGAPDRMRRHVEELVIDPSRQSQRLEALIWRAKAGDADAAAILAPFGPGFFDVQEVVRISVTLEDFSIVAAAEAELRLSGWLPEDVPLATTIGLADLAAVGEILGDAAQLVHYLAERQRVARTFQVLGDEMDYLGLYLKSGFNIAGLEAKMQSLSISGMSAEIDKWFADRLHGHKTAKPRLAIHRYFENVIGEILRRKFPGWLAIILDILRAFDREEQAKVVKELEKLRREAVRRRADSTRTATLLLTPPASRRTAILFHVFPPEQAEKRREWTQDLAAMAFENSGRSRCLLIGRNTSRWNDSYAYLALVEDGPSAFNWV